METIINNYVEKKYDSEYENDIGKKFITSLCKHISFEKYLSRLFKYMNCSDSCYILALMYLEKMHNQNKNIISKNNIHTIFFVSLYVAVKWHDDDFYIKNFYEKVGCLTSDEFIEMEILFLEIINFDAFVSISDFYKFTFVLML